MNSIISVESIGKFHDMFGLDKPEHPLISLIDFSKIDFRKQANVKMALGFYIIMQKNLCPGAFGYGRNYYDFQEGTLFFLSPNQATVLENPDESADINGWGLFFHPEFIRRTSLNAKMKEYSFFSYNLYEALHLSNKEANKLQEIVDGIRHELAQNIDKHSRTLIVSTIELLLNYCNRYYDRQFITRTETNKDIIIEFENLLANYFRSEDILNKSFPSVKYFAERLQLSPNYLSDLLKKETGKNGTEHIQYHVVELAKDKLLGTTVSISEIAYDLGFEYPHYFSKMFKKNTGMSPAEYRNVN